MNGTCAAAWWNRLFPGRNPLARRADRVEAAVLRAAVAVAVLALPGAILLGGGVHDARSAIIEHQLTTRYPATAVLRTDAPATGVHGTATTRKVETPAAWVTADGQVKDGVVLAEQRAEAGTEVPIWLDEHGEPVTPPEAPSNAVTAGVAVAVLSWLALLGLCWLGYGLVRGALLRLGADRWQQDWRRIDGAHLGRDG